MLSTTRTFSCLRRRWLCYPYLPLTAPTTSMILRYAHTGPTSESPYRDDRNPVTASGPRSHISPSQNAPEPSDSGLTGQVESVEIRVAPGVQLAGHARQIVAAVLDLLQGKVTRQKMSRKFWAQDAVFEDNMKKAIGIEEVDAQWWGLKALMKDIKMLRHEVTSVAPNRVEMEVENKYVLRHMPTSTGSVVRSTVVIEMDDDGKIKKVQDKRNGHLPEGKLSEYFRRATAISRAKLIGIPKEA